MKERYKQLLSDHLGMPLGASLIDLDAIEVSMAVELNLTTCRP